jgi:hypothetical protein
MGKSVDVSAEFFSLALQKHPSGSDDSFPLDGLIQNKR